MNLAELRDEISEGIEAMRYVGELAAKSDRDDEALAKANKKIGALEKKLASARKASSLTSEDILLLCKGRCTITFDSTFEGKFRVSILQAGRTIGERYSAKAPLFDAAIEAARDRLIRA